MSSEPALKSTYILVVDDDPAVRDGLKFALETDGMAVKTFPGGRQMLESGSLGKADCLILDCRMPEMDGFAVLAELAARKARLPVILMTAPVTEAIRRRAREAGAFNLLEKPLLGGILVDNIRRATT